LHESVLNDSSHICFKNSSFHKIEENANYLKAGLFAFPGISLTGQNFGLRLNFIHPFLTITKGRGNSGAFSI
jgi:hypothetical protein